MESELHDTFFRLFFIIFLFFCILALSFPGDPYIKITQKLDKNDPVLSSTMKIFLKDVIKDSTREIIIQNNYKFAVYELDLENESLILRKHFTLSPIQLGNGPHYFCFGCLEPDSKDILLILTPNALFKKDLNVQDEDILTTPEKIMGCSLYPQEKQATRIDFEDFAIDIEGDGYDELFLPREDTFALYKKKGNEVKNIPLPSIKKKRYTELYTFKTYVTYSSIISPFIGLVSPCEGKAKSLYIYHKPEDTEKREIHIYRALTPLSFSKEPDQKIIMDRKSSFKYNQFRIIWDFDKDGFMDLLLGDSNLNEFSPLTIIRFYKASQNKTSILEKPNQQIRLRDSKGKYFFNDFSGDGFMDFCLLKFDYNFSSTEDIVEFFLNNYIRYRLDFHYYDTKIPGYSSIPAVSLPIRIKRSIYQYRHPKFSFCLNGDFNGDGLKDIMVLASQDRGEIYLQNPEGISKKPYTTFPADKILLFNIDDLDGGGKDDIVLMSMEKKILSLYLFR